jgi:hypothetical protein
VASHDEYTHQILTAIESGRPVTQRSLSRDLGVALGLTNLLLRRLINKGYVKVTGIQRKRVAYLITPAGIVEKSRVSRAYLENTVRLYTETRERIRSSFDALSASWSSGDGAATDEKRIVFYGAGEVAEIGYVSLQRTDLHLVGVVDDFVRTPFFGLPVSTLEQLGDGMLNGQTFDRLVIMSMRKSDQMQARLGAIGFPSSRITLLL